MSLTKQRKNLENLALEVIEFLKKWGLWEDVAIFTNGNKYSHSYKDTDCYKGLSNVIFTENQDPEKYMSGAIEGINGETIWKSCANPEHIFDMVFEGPLYGLLNNFEYEVKKANITEEAWDYIFEHTEILEEYIEDEFGCYGVSEFLELNTEGKFINSEFITWNPLLFDTWEEYQELISGKEYAIYFENMEASEVVGGEKLFLPVWEQIVKESKKKFIREYRCDCEEILYLPEIAEYVHLEFINIFEKYGLYFELCFNWSLTCYKG